MAIKRALDLSSGVRPDHIQVQSIDVFPGTNSAVAHFEVYLSADAKESGKSALDRKSVSFALAADIETALVSAAEAALKLEAAFSGAQDAVDK